MSTPSWPDSAASGTESRPPAALAADEPPRRSGPDRGDSAVGVAGGILGVWPLVYGGILIITGIAVRRQDRPAIVGDRAVADRRSR